MKRRNKTNKFSKGGRNPKPKLTPEAEERLARAIHEENWDNCYCLLSYLIILICMFVTGGMYFIPNKPKYDYLDKSDASTNGALGSTPTNEQYAKFLDMSCDDLMGLAKELMEGKPPSEWEPALDLLATCVLQEPHNSVPRWNLAMMLLDMDHEEEGLEFLDQALTLDPNNLEYLKASGSFFSKMGLHSKVVRCLEHYLEASLKIHSWEHLLASISIQRADEWVFLYDAGADIVDILEMLQSSYLQEKAWIKAGYLYKVIIGLRGEEEVDMNLLLMYSTFAFGLGDFSTGIKYLRLYTERQYMMEGYGDPQQAYEVVTAHSLRLLTAGFDSQLLSIGKNLLMAGDSVWEELVYNCELTEKDKFNYTVSLRLRDLQKVVKKCLHMQNVINSLVDDGAVVYAENLFGWSPLLHAVALGGGEGVGDLLNARADPQSRTVLGHTSLHIAAMRGTYNDITLPLTQAGLKSSEVDYFNRTALHIACLHGWSAKGMADVLTQQLPQGCPVKPIYHPPLKLSTYGGWQQTSIALPSTLTSERCDFDVLSVPDVETFIFDHLSLQRPVLVRNATGVHSMKKLHQLWHRSKFKHEFGALSFNEVEIPYAESFGYTTTKKTTAKDFLADMKQFQEENSNIPLESIKHPSYIFETLPPNSPLIKEFIPPSILDKKLTHISPLKMQFYLGPPLSGAPVHFHRNAWNLLIYGQKRWFLYPPDKAFYSKQHVWDWWRETYSKSPDALECVQYPGDLVFVPDMWGHAVINLREGVGVASEFIYGASEFSI